MLDEIEKLFSTKDLYELLKITSKEANDAKKLRNAYLRAALSYHPDKAIDDKQATQKFQILSQIYEMLKDEDLKKAYDHTGEWPAEKFDIDLTGFSTRIDMEVVEQFKKEYQGSEAERDDIKKCYENNEGSFIKLFDTIFFINVVDDLERVTKIVEDAIEAGELKRIPPPKGYPARWKKFLAKCQREAKEAEEILASMKDKYGSSRKKGRVDDTPEDDSLQALILKRNEARGTSFLDQLEAKYGGASQEKKRRKTSKK